MTQQLDCKDICEFVYKLVCDDCKWDEECNKYEINHVQLLKCAKRKLKGDNIES